MPESWATIFVITLSVRGFAGTRIITGLMLLADLYLLAWDFDRWKALVPGGVDRRSRVGGTQAWR